MAKFSNSIKAIICEPFVILINCNPYTLVCGRIKNKLFLLINFINFPKTRSDQEVFEDPENLADPTGSGFGKSCRSDRIRIRKILQIRPDPDPAKSCKSDRIRKTLPDPNGSGSGKILQIRPDPQT